MSQKTQSKIARCAFVDSAIFDAFGHNPPWRRQEQQHCECNEIHAVRDGNEWRCRVCGNVVPGYRFVR